MIEQSKIIGIIPARGGSKGIPRKNIKPLAGKPLIAWSIEQAKKSKYLDQIVVSTDSPEIAEIARQYGAEAPFLRPAELAQDDSPTVDAIFHVLQFFDTQGEHFDLVVLLEPTSPLRKEDDIDRAIELFETHADRVDSLVSLGEVHMENPYIVKQVEGGYVKPLILADSPIHQRQQLPRTYFPYGVIYLSTVYALKKWKTFYQERTIPYFIERWQNYEIDDIWDFLCVEAVLQERKHHTA